MSYKILETVIVDSYELEQDNDEFIIYFINEMKCPWRSNNNLWNFLKFHKIVDGFLVEFGGVTWGHSTTIHPGFFKIDNNKNYLVSKYF